MLAQAIVNDGGARSAEAAGAARRTLHVLRARHREEGGVHRGTMSRGAGLWGLTRVIDSTTMAAVGPDELRRRRRALGYSQPEFAMLLGVTEVTVSRWENGVHKVPGAVGLLIQQMRPKRGGRPKRTR